MTTARGGTPDPVGGRVGHPGGENAVQSATQWGRRQAARAPQWSPEKRRRMAVLLGLGLPDSWADRDGSREVGHYGRVFGSNNG